MKKIARYSFVALVIGAFALGSCAQDENLEDIEMNIEKQNDPDEDDGKAGLG